MLLRSSSNPSLSSLFNHQTHNHNDFCIKKSPSFSLLTDLSHIPHTKVRRHSFTSVNKCLRNACVDHVVEDVVGEESEMVGGLLMFSSSGLGLDGEESCSVGGGGDGGRMCGGSSGDGGGGGEGDGTDLYYKSMIDANPGNSLILGNYAKYLKEVKGDLVKAEEYCSRAILANPSDGNALSMYADLIWVTQKDSSRAETYFDQAVKASPDDCYVMASYAHFLWDADEEDEEEVSSMNISPPSFLHEASQQFPVAAT